MKKIITGMTVLMLLTGTAFANGNTKKAAKAKKQTECKIAVCKDKKDCKPAPDCPKVCKPASCGK